MVKVPVYYSERHQERVEAQARREQLNKVAQVLTAVAIGAIIFLAVYELTLILSLLSLARQ